MTPVAIIDHVRASSARDSAADTALAWLAANGFPTERDEAWRYTATGGLMATLADTEPDTARPISPAEFAATVAAALCPRLVMVNGRFAAALSDLGPVAEGLSVTTQPRSRTIDDHPAPADGFEAMNRACAHEVVVVTAHHGAHVGPLHVVHLTAPGGGPPLTHPRTVIDASPGSRLEVVEVFEGFAEVAFTNAVTSIDVAAGAEVSYQRVQLEGLDTTHVGRTAARLGTGSVLHVTAVEVGAAQSRHSIDVSLEHRDASVELTGLCVPAGSQRHDTHVDVHHLASHCRSSQLFKGALDGHARGSFTGRVVVAADTTGTDASQLNHNLVLSPDAQANSRPWLEIFSDDVRCTHGATVGRLDDDAIFYLRSRGIPVALAQSMLVDAFVAEILESGLGAQIRARVGGVIAARHEEMA
jgi:Fe-S cluster assembly protein SufD